MNVVILVPRRADHGPRDRLWEFCRPRWEENHPEWRILEGHHNDGPFNRSAAINLAAKDAGDWDAAVIIDSDVVIDPAQVVAAVNNASAKDRITFAYNRYCYLSKTATRSFLNGGELGPPEWIMDDRHGGGHCSSVVVVSRYLWSRVGGFDERFRGWGEEDVGFSLACQLAGGGYSRIRGDVWHLWHPISPERDTKSPGYLANVAHRERYVAARSNWDAMEALLAEEGGPLA